MIWGRIFYEWSFYLKNTWQIITLVKGDLYEYVVVKMNTTGLKEPLHLFERRYIEINKITKDEFDRFWWGRTFFIFIRLWKWSRMKTTNLVTSKKMRLDGRERSDEPPDVWRFIRPIQNCCLQLFLSFDAEQGRSRGFVPRNMASRGSKFSEGFGYAKSQSLAIHDHG